MLFLLFFLFLTVAAAVIGVLSSGFLEFYNTFGEIENYHKAYYSSISALERAELVLKYRSPGFEGSGGRNNKTKYTRGPQSDYQQKFGYYKDMDDGGNSWEIRSKTKQIPKNGEGNVNWMFLSGDDSLNYNVLDYMTTETFSFSLDNTTGTEAYKTTPNIKKSSLTNFTGTIRLPAFLKDKLGNLLNTNTTTHPFADIGNDEIYNDVMINREIDGKYENESFTIYPTVSINYNDKKINNEDSTIREDVINGGNTLTFGNNKNPIRPHANNEILTILSNQEDHIKEKTFKQIFQDANATGMLFKIALLNLLHTDKKQVYPYLEYQFSFDKDIADRYYTIEAKGKYKDYESKILVKKPTNKDSILGSFTVIF